MIHKSAAVVCLLPGHITPLLQDFGIVLFCFAQPITYVAARLSILVAGLFAVHSMLTCIEVQMLCITCLGSVGVNLASEAASCKD